MNTEEDEIEFFECVPIALIDSFKHKLIENIKATIENNLNSKTEESDDKLNLNEIISQLEDNLIIFESFIIRNIFTFPKREFFTLERKVTDQRIEGSFESFIDENFTKIVDENIDLCKHLIKIENKIELTEFKIREITNFIEQTKDSCMKLCQKKADLEIEWDVLCKKTDEIECMDINQNVSGIDILLDDPKYQNMMSSILLKKEEEYFDINEMMKLKKLL